MSDYEAHKGTITRVPSVGTLEETLLSLLTDKQQKKYREYEWSILEFLGEELYNEYVLINDELYKIDDIRFDPYDGFINFEQVEDGKYKYSCRFYNGGTCLSEMLEDELDSINQ